MNSTLWLNLAVAMGIGLLIGAERERKKGTGPNRSFGGIRTFTLASLLGAVSSALNFWLLVTSIFCVMTFTAIGYYKQRDKDPGITTEIALVMTVILGGLAMSAPALSAAIAVSVAILLVAKEPMHGFVLNMLTKDELTDFLILAAATLIILPIVPNASVGPFEAINPRNLWIVVILVMTISALGHLVLRWLGARIGLPLVGLISGFISSVATIAAMGERAKETPSLVAAAVAGAALSSLATILQLAILLAAVHPPTLHVLAWPLAFGGFSILLYGVLVAIKSFHQNQAEITKPTKTFSVKSALILVVVIAAVLIISSALKAWFGQAGLVLASGIAGLADAHAPTIAVASQAAAGKLVLENTALPILVAFSANSIGKGIMAFVSGDKTYSMQVILGLMIQVTSVWVGWWLT
ncbi:MAG TPA: MgtC/SapB family protein [Methylophilaceae bacterium]